MKVIIFIEIGNYEKIFSTNNVSATRIDFSYNFCKICLNPKNGNFEAISSYVSRLLEKNKILEKGTTYFEIDSILILRLYM